MHLYNVEFESGKIVTEYGYDPEETKEFCLLAYPNERVKTITLY